MILLSSVLATVVSQAGLGTDPVVHVPMYELKSPAGEYEEEEAWPFRPRRGDENVRRLFFYLVAIW